MAIAAEIAHKSPLAIWGTKETVNYSRDHSVADSLNYIATWQSGMFQPEDMIASFEAQAGGNDPEFAPLPAIATRPRVSTLGVRHPACSWRRPARRDRNAVGVVIGAVACSGDDDASDPAAPSSPAPIPVVPPSSTIGTSTTTSTTSTTMPPLADAEVGELASALGVATLVVEESDGAGLVTWADGRAGRVDVPADTFAWSDGGFVYWQTREPQERGPDAVTSFAATFDGTPVCESPGEIESVVPRDDEIVTLEDGQFEAVIEFEPVVDDSGQWPRPRARFDCSTWATPTGVGPVAAGGRLACARDRGRPHVRGGG